MKLLNANMHEINGSEIDLSKGKIYKKTIVKPDTTPVDNITKFVYEVDDYEDVQVFILPGEIVPIDRIEELKKNLSATDYVVMKIAEGVATADDYSDVLEQRKLWRKEINSLEESIR